MALALEVEGFAFSMTVTRYPWPRRRKRSRAQDIFAELKRQRRRDSLEDLAVVAVTLARCAWLERPEIIDIKDEDPPCRS